MQTEIKLTRVGILLGSLVPILATVSDLIWSHLSFTFDSLVLLYQRDYLLWIILTTPVAIGLVFHYFARQVKVHEDELIADRNKNHEELNKLEAFIYDIESGASTDRDYNFSNQRLADILASLKGKLVHQKQEDERARWVAEGHAKFGEIFRGTTDLKKLSDEVIKNLVKITSSNQGSIFIINESDPQKPLLELTSCYAYDRKKFETKVVEPGEGLIGQCYLERDTIVMTEVPRHYIKITSGLGEATPNFIVIVPIQSNKLIEGVLEIASFNHLDDYQIKFLEKICEGFATVIRSAKATEETKSLLETAQHQTEQLRAQEEEMRQNMEELNAMQEAMERKTKEADEHAQTLRAIFDSTIDAILTISENGIIETVNKATLDLFQYNEDDLIGNSILSILPAPSGAARDQYLKSLVSSNQKKSEKIKIADGRKKDGKLFPTELAVNEANTGDHRLFTAIIHDITYRKQLEAEALAQLEEMRAQEEELRQNMEQLQALQDLMTAQLEETKRMRNLAETREAVLGLTTILSETDLRGVITYANEKFCEISKYDREELIGQPQNIVRHPDMPKELFRLFWATIKQGNVFHGIVKNRAKDGSAYWVDATIVPIKNEEGKIIKYIGARNHIKEEKIALEMYNKQADHYHRPHIDKLEFLLN